MIKQQAESKSPHPPFTKGGRGGISSESGFTLIELLITMVIFTLVIAAGSQIFTGLLTQFKQQSKIAETNIEGLVGLEILRQDIEHTGYGLPWNITGVVDADSDGNFWEHLAGYSEAVSTGSPDPANFNDATRDIDGDANDGEAPRAILSDNNTGLNGSDYLVIKAINVARNATSQKWTHLRFSNVLTAWTPDCENVNKNQDCSTNNNARVIVLAPGSTNANGRSLVVSTTTGAFFTQYSNTADFVPLEAVETHIVYGADTSTDLRMPFNRADYYILNSNVPQRCSSNTGVLEKAAVNQNGGGLNFMPLLDCVADMQIVYLADTNNDGTIDNNTDDIANLVDSNGNGVIDAQEIREQIREVRVYILAHEGQYDSNYTYPNQVITVGEFGMGSNVDLAATIGTNWQNYRWKTYTIVVNPNNLR